MQTAAAPKRAKRTNSRKRFHEDEGYEEAEVMLVAKLSWVKHTCCTRLVYTASWALDCLAYLHSVLCIVVADTGCTCSGIQTEMHAGALQ